jgi:transcriptional regulator with XRE-family HTH domain
VATVAEYCRHAKLTYADLARACGVTPGRISQLAIGNARSGKPSWSLAGKLERVSGGLIPRSQYFPDDLHCDVSAPPTVPDLPHTQTKRRASTSSARPSEARK